MKVKQPTAEAETGRGAAAARSKPVESPRAVLRIVNILDRVADNPTGCTLSFLSQATGAPKSSLLNLLRGLVAGGYLDVVGGAYVLGAESYRLAVTIAASSRLPELSRVVVRRLSERTGETALISVLTSDHQMTYIDKFESSNTIRAHVSIGERRPAYSSAGGRAVLAFLPPEQIEAFFATVKIERVTPATETRRARLKEMLATVRAQGYAVTVGEAEVGLTGVAAPIFDNLGAPVGSLILSGPSERMDPHLTEWPKLVLDAAADLSHLRGYRKPIA
jgi:IclR family acetate operon transcriptional repressor